jgi:hypothetical protein
MKDAGIVWACSALGVDDKCVTKFVWIPEGKKPLGTTERGSEGKVKIDLKGIYVKEADCIFLLSIGTDGGL